MHSPTNPSNDNLTRKDLLPTVRSLAWVLLLFGAAIVLSRLYAAPIGAVLADHGCLGIAIFFATTALAVVVPLFSNLPLVPFAVLLWGPWWTVLPLPCCSHFSQRCHWRIRPSFCWQPRRSLQCMRCGWCAATGRCDRRAAKFPSLQEAQPEQKLSVSRQLHRAVQHQHIHHIAHSHIALGMVQHDQAVGLHHA